MFVALTLQNHKSKSSNLEKDVRQINKMLIIALDRLKTRKEDSRLKSEENV